jgi:hypothetical protein
MQQLTYAIFATKSLQQLTAPEELCNFPLILDGNKLLLPIFAAFKRFFSIYIICN